jgi:hypothetical protein
VVELALFLLSTFCMAISLEEVRRRILIALFSDDELMDALVLKGGNALALIYKVGSRASLDMDFSIKNAFADVDKAGERILAALKHEFGVAGYVLFDEKFGVKPSQPTSDQPAWWGGYQVEFKLAVEATYDKFADDLEGLRRNSEVLGPLQKRKYTIDISQNEFCEGKVQREVDDYIIYVYSLEMIAAEKLRALCQQMPEYKFNRTPSPRARDFYDIHQIVDTNGIDLTTDANLAIISAVLRPRRCRSASCHGLPISAISTLRTGPPWRALSPARKKISTSISPMSPSWRRN